MGVDQVSKHDHSTESSGGKSIAPESVDTEELGISESDFVANGDYVPWYTFNANSSTSITFTDTSYAASNGLSRIEARWDTLFPSGVQPAIFATARVNNVGSGETVSLRVRNPSDSETVEEVTGITSTGMITVGPTNYQPQTTAEQVTLRWEWKEDTGSNSSSIIVPWISLGVQL